MILFLALIVVCLVGPPLVQWWRWHGSAPFDPHQPHVLDDDERQRLDAIFRGRR